MEKKWQFPIIQGFGKVWPLQNVACIPEPDRTYQVLVSVFNESTGDSSPLPGLIHAANAINVFAQAGVRTTENLMLAAIVYGPAISGILRNEVFLRENGKENPNVDLVSKLKNAGAEILACGQMLHMFGYSEEDLLPEATLTFSGVATLVEYQDRGYRLIPSSTGEGNN